MKFGQVANPSAVDFTIPADHADTRRVLEKANAKDMSIIFICCAKWNKTDLNVTNMLHLKEKLGQ